ncbi:formate/nitrite transporter family protein [Enterococcus sp. AZ072]|uniref:formate/nitrite transporter family protein n=1 Tax=unclassified Enterococcus TaxID=2608891 RepID=UPI003D2834B4
MSTAVVNLLFFAAVPGKFFAKSVMAGVYLGIAMTLSLALASTVNMLHPALAKIAFAMFFGLTFVLIVFLNGELFTGNCLTTAFPLINHSQTLSQLVKLWVVCLFVNSVDVLLFGFLFIQSKSLDSLIYPYLKSLVYAKQDFTLISLFIKSVLCNLIVCIATYTALKMKDELAKTVIMLLTIMIFVLCGFDHCIANIGLYVMQILVDPSVLNWKLIFESISLSILGNVVGGAGLLALPLYFSSRETKRSSQVTSGLVDCFLLYFFSATIRIR